jgi:hypothetical protein
MVDRCKDSAGFAAILNMAVFAENFQTYHRKIEPRGSKTSKTHCDVKLFARRWSKFRIADWFIYNVTEVVSFAQMIMLPEGMMTTEEKMPVDDRFKYLRRVKRRYVQADRKERGRLLDEMEAMTGLHRKSVTRLINGNLKRKPRHRERNRTYGPEVDDALRVIARSMNYICAERLAPNLPWIAEHMAAHGELALSSELLEKLSRISISTTKRILARIRQDEPRLPRKRPKQTNCLTKDIPMTHIPWDEQEPGHFEVDLVHHCGPSASGEYICTLQMIDVATGWSERQAVLGRSFRVMEDAFRCVLGRLPFPVLEIHPDNGSEFLNHHLLRFWKDAVKGVRLSRSRPYHKNDNRFVEQKNSSLVRAYLGADRLDTVAQTLFLNQVYDKLWLYDNFFQPVMRLKEKLVIPAAGDRPGRVIRRHDSARTPFDRLCQTNTLSPEIHQQLKVLRDRTSLLQLQEEICNMLDDLFSLPNATPGITENIFLTLLADGYVDSSSLRSDLPTYPQPLRRRDLFNQPDEVYSQPDSGNNIF